MKPHPRIRKTVKWGGTVLTVLLAVVWVGSAWWKVRWGNVNRNVVSIGHGRVEFVSDPWGKEADEKRAKDLADCISSFSADETDPFFKTGSITSVQLRQQLEVARVELESRANALLFRLRLNRVKPEFSIRFDWSDSVSGNSVPWNPSPPLWIRGSTRRWVKIPLWVPAVLCAALTMYVCRLNSLPQRRTRAGCCTRCNHNRQGIPATAVCPECGVPGVPVPSTTEKVPA